ncbi:hypothetical protein [Paramagnetospirillum magnetotacticum]|uniref:hypothetical protein n=1 Tax=Paramagnetospirillum magnetotacticum TaxID=188 RepID=UPI001269B99A|nr:hypothetical protein [Paramagnetospirillum magnetotacticum]
MPRKKTTPAKPTGRPRFEPTREQRAAVTTLAAAGFSAEKIAVALTAAGAPVCGNTVRKVFAAELAGGVAQVEALAVRTLVQAMQRGSVPAATFWLKYRSGWRDGIVVAVEPSAGSPEAQVAALAGVRHCLSELAEARRNGTIFGEEIAAMSAALSVRH